MAAWLDEVEGLVNRVREAMESFKNDDRFHTLPAMEALGAYVTRRATPEENRATELGQFVVEVPLSWVIPEGRVDNEEYVQGRKRELCRGFSHKQRHVRDLIYKALDVLYLGRTDSATHTMWKRMSGVLEPAEVHLLGYFHHRTQGSEKKNYGSECLRAARRAGYRCQQCGFPDVRALQSHHVNGREDNTDFEYLCASCHQIETHTLGRERREYKLPTQLSAFQQKLYVHLIEWKWRAGMPTAGSYGGRNYDAILTPEDARKRILIYDDVRGRLDQHHARFPFRFHEHFNHMASSQAACVNLFLPLLVSGAEGEEVLRAANPDLARVDREHLDEGFCLEYWGARAGEKPGEGERVGLLKDKTVGTGTDCDIAIAYRDHDDRPCLWMIEHKLTEPEFTTCGAYTSDGRKKARKADPSAYDCGKSLPEIIADKDTCYYHKSPTCGFDYWNLTDTFQSFFPNHAAFKGCPFRGGMNQLWRNQLLALAIEQRKDPFEKVTFSVVKHPRNRALDATLADYRRLIGDTDRFFHFDSSVLVDATVGQGHADLMRWAEWYRGLYDL